MKEAEFQKTVIEVAHRLGWKVAHFGAAQIRPGVHVTPVKADGKGFPDLVMVRGHRIVLAELKADKGRLSTEQEGWVDALAEAALEVYVWRPKDFDRLTALLR